MCHSWVFTENGVPYSIVVVSTIRIPHVFLKLLGDARLTLSYERDPEEKLRSIAVYLGAWRMSNGDSALVYMTPCGRFRTDSVMDDTLKAFDPTICVGRAYDLKGLWRVVIAGQPVLVVGRTAQSVSNTVLSIASLVRPFVYFDGMLPFTCPADARWRQAVCFDGLPQWRIVGIVADAEKMVTSSFTVVRVPASRTGVSGSIRKELKEWTKALQSRLEKAMDAVRLRNPFSDNLNAELDLGTDGLPGGLTESALRGFLASETFRRWRRDGADVWEVREALLASIPAAVSASLPPDEQRAAGYIARQWRRAFRGDRHVLAVLARYCVLLG
jgi:hypothetical protein